MIYTKFKSLHQVQVAGSFDTDTNTTQQEAGELFSSTFINYTNHVDALRAWLFLVDRVDA